MAVAGICLNCLKITSSAGKTLISLISQGFLSLRLQFKHQTLGKHCSSKNHVPHKLWTALLLQFQRTKPKALALCATQSLDGLAAAVPEN